MSLLQPPQVMGARDDHTAVGMRMLIRALSGITEGVVGEDDLFVTARGGDLGVDIAPGSGFALGDTEDTQGTYFFINDASASVTLDAASHAATHSRNDLIYVILDDTDYAGSTDTVIFDQVAGTPATTGTQVDPTVPDSALVLARAVVKGGTTEMDQAGNSVVDLRQRVAQGYVVIEDAYPYGTLYGPSGEAGTGQGRDAKQGDLAYAKSGNALLAHDGSILQTAVTNGVWTGYTPTLIQSGAVAKTVSHARYARYGRLIVGNVVLAVTASGTAANAITSTLPVTTALAGTDPVVGTFRHRSGSTNRQGLAVVTSGTTIKFITDNSTDYFGVNPAVTLANGDTLSFEFAYEANA